VAGGFKGRAGAYCYGVCAGYALNDGATDGGVEGGGAEGGAGDDGEADDAPVPKAGLAGLPRNRPALR
jgi:hypothetical protein